MYGLTTVTPPASAPVTAAELRARLRLNTSAEDGDLDEFIASAVELFEHDTRRPVLATSYRQDLSRWPGTLLWPGVPHAALPCVAGGPVVVLGCGGVTAVTAVKKYLADGSTEDLDASAWRADLTTPPARVTLSAVPAPVQTAAGITVTPVGCVEFTAGWANAAAVPKQVITALKLMAAHWYENREAWTSENLREVPDGWCRVVARFKTGLSGSWGQ